VPRPLAGFVPCCATLVAREASVPPLMITGIRSWMAASYRLASVVIDPDGKTPFAVARVDGDPVAFGGIWEVAKVCGNSPSADFHTVTPLVVGGRGHQAAALRKRGPKHPRPGDGLRPCVDRLARLLRILREVRQQAPLQLRQGGARRSRAGERPARPLWAPYSTLARGSAAGSPCRRRARGLQRAGSWRSGPTWARIVTAQIGAGKRPHSCFSERLDSPLDVRLMFQ
jgi:hypothetical protein